MRHKADPFQLAASLALLAISGLAGCSNHNSGSGSTKGAGGHGAGSGAAASGSSTTGRTGPISSGGVARGTCPTASMTQTCCGTGTQTCSGTTEFLLWGPCLASSGETLTCPDTNDPCGAGEFGPSCLDGGPRDGGTGNPPCLPGEFGPGCESRDSGTGNPPCAPGEFGPNCTRDGGGGGGDGGTLCPPSDPACDVGKYCTDPTVNNEGEILVGYEPGPGQSVSSCGQVKVWVNDEFAPFIAPNEQVDPTTGQVIAPGDRNAIAPDGLLYEPALYIGSSTPIFPVFIKGFFNNDPQHFTRVKGMPSNTISGAMGAPIDTPPPGTSLSQQYADEYIWDLCPLHLAPGTYTGVFVVADGDRNRAVGCVTIVVTP